MFSQTASAVWFFYKYDYKTTEDKSLDSITVDGNTVKPNTDALGRNTGKTVVKQYYVNEELHEDTVAEEKISYVKFGDHATSLPSTVRFAKGGVFNDTIQYRYDSMGNIVEILENGRSACRYEYDALGRLTREDNFEFKKTFTFAYDNNGNILARYEYPITAKPTSELYLLDGTCKLYTYANNSDKLISYNGEDFVYDDIGNPSTYRGKAVTWANGRQMTAFDGNSFTYDARGRRTAKNDITFTYDSNGNLIKQSNGLEFLYDHTGVFAVKYNDVTYFYRKNAQQDIIALLDSNGNIMVKYKYDAFGMCKALSERDIEITVSNHIGTLNPFRYRSYYFDTETNLYFLKTRYYDPETGRFITIDDISYLDPESINGLNLYAYCGNNPVNCVDPTGEFPIVALIVGTVVGALAGGITSAFSSGIINGNTGWALFGDILAGTLIGAALGAATVLGGLVATGAISAMTGVVSLGISTITSYMIGMGSYIISHRLKGESVTLSEAASYGVTIAVKSIFNFGIGYLYGISGNWNTLNQGVYTNMLNEFREAGHGFLKSVLGAAASYFITSWKEMLARSFLRGVSNKAWDYIQQLN